MQQQIEQLEVDKIWITQEQDKWKEKATELDYNINELEYQPAPIEKFKIERVVFPLPCLFFNSVGRLAMEGFI